MALLLEGTPAFDSICVANPKFDTLPPTQDDEQSYPPCVECIHGHDERREKMDHIRHVY